MPLKWNLEVPFRSLYEANARTVPARLIYVFQYLRTRSYLPISGIVKISDTFRRGKLKKNPVREVISQIGNKTCYGKSRTEFTRHGEAVAAIVPMEDRELRG